MGCLSGATQHKESSKSVGAARGGVGAGGGGGEGGRRRGKRVHPLSVQRVCVRVSRDKGAGQGNSGECV